MDRRQQDGSSFETDGRSRPRRALFALGGVAAAGMVFAPSATAAEAVLSVNGRTGDVVLDAASVGAAATTTVDRIAIVASPDRFPGLDPTGAGDSSAGLQAAFDSVPSGGTLVVPPGRYRVNSSVTSDRKTLTVCGYGATLIKGADAPPVLKLAGGYSAALAVQSLSAVTLDKQRGVAVVVDGSPAWAVGDIVKLVADDLIPECRRGNGTSESRVGEYFVVQSTSGSTINVYGVLRESYTSNVRLARVEDYQVHLAGLSFETAPEGMPTAWTGSVVTLSAFLRPTTSDLAFRSAPGPALTFRGCYAYRADNIAVNNATDSSSTGNFGYAILDNSCAYGSITNLSANRVRHGYTDDTARIAAGGSPVQYGRTFGTRISDSVVQGATLSAFDTHSVSENVEFVNCSAYDSYVGFKLRGRKHHVVNGSAIACEYGLQIDTEDTGSDDSWGHRVNGFYAERIPSGAVVVSPHLAQAGRETLRETRSISLTDVVIEDSTPQAVQVTNAVCFVDGLRIRASEYSPNGREILRFTNSEVRGRDWDIDLTSNTAGTGLSLVTPRNGGVLDVSDVRVRWSGDLKSRFYTLINATEDVVVAIARLEIPEPINSISKRLAQDARVTWSSPSATSATITRKEYQVSDTVTADYVARSANPAVSLICVVTGAGKALPPLLNGAFIGQIVTIINSPESTKNVTLRHGPAFGTRLTKAVDLVIGPSGDAALFWTGAIWKQVYA